MLDGLRRIDAIVKVQCGRALLTGPTKVKWPRRLRLEPEVKAFYAAADFIEDESPVHLPFHPLSMLGARAALALWKELCEVAAGDEDAAEFFDETGDDGRVRAILFHELRFPIAAQPNDAHYLLVDGVPGPKGRTGQLLFNPSEATFDCLAPSATHFFDQLARQLETGELRFAGLPHELGDGFRLINAKGKAASPDQRTRKTPSRRVQRGSR